MATREERFRQAAWAYLVYGVIYWLGGLYLAARDMTMGRGIFWFVFGGLLIVIIPLLLSRDFRWFDRWILSRRDFCRILTVLVALRAFGVGRVALAPQFQSVPLAGSAEIPMSVGAGIFFLITLAAGAMLARAAWSPRE